MEYKEVLKKLSYNLQNKIESMLNKSITLGYIKEKNDNTIKLEINSYNNIWLSINGTHRKFKFTVFDGIEKAVAYSGFLGK